MTQRPEQVPDVFRVADAMAWGVLEEIREVVHEADPANKVELIELPSALRAMLAFFSPGNIGARTHHMLDFHLSGERNARYAIKHLNANGRYNDAIRLHELLNWHSREAGSIAGSLFLWEEESKR